MSLKPGLLSRICAVPSQCGFAQEASLAAVLVNSLTPSACPAPELMHSPPNKNEKAKKCDP